MFNVTMGRTTDWVGERVCNVPRIERVFAGVLEDHLAGNLRVSTASVLAGPFDRKNATGVVVHSLVLGELLCLSSIGIEVLKSSCTIFRLKGSVPHCSRAGIAAVVVVLA